MRVDFFEIPALAPNDAAEDLNRLLSSARILTVDREFVSDGPRSFWSICVMSQTGPVRGVEGAKAKKGRIDYREVLSPEDFAIYARLRDLRKDLAGREGVPPYAVFTNEQLAEIVETRAVSTAALRKINGVGDARIERYGGAVLAAMTALLDEQKADDHET